MQHAIAVKIAEIINKDFAGNKCTDYSAYVTKENKEDLKTTDDWYVKISEKQ